MNKNEVRKELVILIGIQGSGKTTFAHRFCENQKECMSYKYISLDQLNTRNKEREAFVLAIKNGASILIDNTNPTIADRKKYIDVAKAEGYVIKGYYLKSIISECVVRNNKREGKARVPETAIAHTSNIMVLPEYSEGFDELYYVQFDESNNVIIEEWRK